MSGTVKTSNGISRLIRWRFGLPHARRGDAARLRTQWVDAVISYRRALDWMPWREDLKIQIGNCLKEFGDFDGAISAYRSVSAGGDREEAFRQIADVNRRDGITVHSFFVDDRLDGGAADGARWEKTVHSADLPNRIRLDAGKSRRWLRSLGNRSGTPRRMAGNIPGAIKLDQVGAMSLEREGTPEPLFAGIVAVRGRILSMGHVDGIEIVLGDGPDVVSVAKMPTQLVKLDQGPLNLHVFNAWIDSAALPAGRHWMSVRTVGSIKPAGLFVNVADHADDHAFASSNAFVPSSGAGGTCDEYVEALPTVSRSALRSLCDHEIRTILVMRADQLGDVAASLPALARLRVLFPHAHMTALVQPGIDPIVKASGVADEVLTVHLPYDHGTERRYIETVEEDRLREQLKKTHFDLAIDLSPGDETRPLLLLAKATYLAGFNPDRFPFLDLGISIRSRDKVNQLEKNSHAVNVLALVETLALALTPSRAPVPRVADSRAALADQGLTAGRYIVIHTGARHEINKWPFAKFLDLARALLDRTAYDIVFFSDPGDEQHLPKDMGKRMRFQGRTEMDLFDSILSNAAIMIANDSGPKHLAATRGVNTISLQVGRLNWNEWGQDSMGTILSRRVPCTGCGLNDVMLCGRDATCLRSISVADVLHAAEKYIEIVN